MNSKHICRRFTVTILVIALLPWSVFFYSGDAKASFHFFSDVSDETEAELEDLIISSDLILDEDLEVSSVALQDESTLDLNGHMLTVRGDFLHSDGTLKVNKGSLFVDGDYRMQKRRLEGENYVYDVAESEMIMQDAEDIITVKGDYYDESRVYNSSNVTAGSLVLCGDYYMLEFAYSFGSGTFRLVLDGDGDQRLDLQDDMSVPVFDIRCRGCVTANKTIKVESELISDCDIPYNGTIDVRNHATLSGNGFSGNMIANYTDFNIENYEVKGNVDCYGYVLISKPLNVKGDFSASMLNSKAALHVGGDLILREGDLYTYSDIQVDGHLASRSNYKSYSDVHFYSGEVTVKGNVENVSFHMKSDEASLLIGGDFISKEKSDFSCGKIQIAGNLDIQSFNASIPNRVILKSNTKQTITLGDNVIFGSLILQNDSEDGVYATSPLTWDSFVCGNTRFCYTDIDGSVCELTDANICLPVTDLTAEAKTTAVTLSFFDPNEDGRVSGYELYRSEDGADFIKVGAFEKNPDTSMRQSYEDTGLKPENKYYYQIMAVDYDSKISVASETLETETFNDTEPPTAPREPYVFGKTGKTIVLSWGSSKDNVGIAGYRVYRDQEILTEELIEETRFKDESVSCNEIHEYYVVAYDLAGNASPESDVILAEAMAPIITSCSPQNNKRVGGIRSFFLLIRNTWDGVL